MVAETPGTAVVSQFWGSESRDPDSGLPRLLEEVVCLGRSSLHACTCLRLNVLLSKATGYMGIGATLMLPFQLHDLVQGLGSKCGGSIRDRVNEFNTCT